MKEKTVKAELVFKKDVAPGIKIFAFRPEVGFEYSAGQWAFWEMEKDGNKLSKPFTIANSPARENLEVATVMSGSEYKNALDSLRPGDEISVRGPRGNFTLAALHKNYVCFLAGGIGITPVRSMLQDMFDRQDNLEAVLFYSNRNADRIAFRKELDEITQQMDSVKVVHTLTDPADREQAEWSGETGYINEEMIKKYRPDYMECQFYIVGPPTFNKTMRNMLMEKMGLGEEYVTLENFAGY